MPDAPDSIIPPASGSSPTAPSTIIPSPGGGSAPTAPSSLVPPANAGTPALTPQTVQPENPGVVTIPPGGITQAAGDERYVLAADNVFFDNFERADETSAALSQATSGHLYTTSGPGDGSSISSGCN